MLHELTANPTRACDGCSMCCFLLPISSMGKKAQTRCPAQGKGKCNIYDRRPIDCRAWSCGWLRGAEIEKPSESGYVLDVIPDFVTIEGDGKVTKLPALQIWLDPKRPDAHECPKLRAFLNNRGLPGLCRIGPKGEGFLLVPPSLASDNQWHIAASNVTMEQEHSAEDIAAVWRGAR